jgi:hypothetical protein
MRVNVRWSRVIPQNSRDIAYRSHPPWPLRKREPCAAAAGEKCSGGQDVAVGARKERLQSPQRGEVQQERSHVRDRLAG